MVKLTLTHLLKRTACHVVVVYNVYKRIKKHIFANKFFHSSCVYAKTDKSAEYEMLIIKNDFFVKL